MTLPKQSVGTVREVAARASFAEGSIQPQRCDRWKKLRCAGNVAACAAYCYVSKDAPGCIQCMGSAYSRCRDCL